MRFFPLHDAPPNDRTGIVDTLTSLCRSILRLYICNCRNMRCTDNGLIPEDVSHQTDSSKAGRGQIMIGLDLSIQLHCSPGERETDVVRIVSETKCFQ